MYLLNISKGLSLALVYKTEKFYLQYNCSLLINFGSMWKDEMGRQQTSLFYTKYS